MLTKLTHNKDNYDLWIDLDEIVALVRNYVPPTSLHTGIIELTEVYLRDGRQFSCKETPDMICDMW